MRHTLNPVEQDRWFATMTTPLANPYGNFAVSGNTAAAAGNWCAGCGRKLAVDGRCEKCDAWHASPLVQVGAPLVALTTIVVAFLVGALRGPAVSAAATTSSLPSLLIAAPPVFQPAALTAPAFVPAAARVSAPSSAAPLPLLSFADTNDAPPAGYAELERLRSLSHYVDTVLAADEAARVPAKGGAAVGSSVPVAY